MKLKYLLFLFLYCSTNLLVFSQFDDSKTLTLSEKITKNNDLFMTEPDKAFLIINVLMEIAVKEGHKD